MAEQVIKLGLTGSETTLESESRAFTSSANEEKSVSGRSADATLHVDFVDTKWIYTITYTVVTDELKDQLMSIYNLQKTNGSFLNFIYTDESGAEVQTTVKMEVPSFGATVVKDEYSYRGTAVVLVEV